MSERTMRSRVVRALRSLDAVAVENRVGPGTPDVNHVHGWLELKWARRWPVDSERPLLIPHYTARQRLWALRRARAGGRSDLLLQVGRCWLLFDAEATKIIGRANAETLGAAAVKRWPNGLIDEELVECVSSKN